MVGNAEEVRRSTKGAGRSGRSGVLVALARVKSRRYVVRLVGRAESCGCSVPQPTGWDVRQVATAVDPSRRKTAIGGKRGETSKMAETGRKQIRNFNRRFFGIFFRQFLVVQQRK